MGNKREQIGQIDNAVSTRAACELATKATAILGQAPGAPMMEWAAIFPTRWGGDDQIGNEEKGEGLERKSQRPIGKRGLLPPSPPHRFRSKSMPAHPPPGLGENERATDPHGRPLILPPIRAAEPAGVGRHSESRQTPRRSCRRQRSGSTLRAFRLQACVERGVPKSAEVMYKC